MAPKFVCGSRRNAMAALRRSEQGEGIRVHAAAAPHTIIMPLQQGKIMYSRSLAGTWRRPE